MKNKPIKPLYRGIVRLSYNQDSKSKFRNSVVPILEKGGFKNTKTGLWETESESLALILRQLNKFMSDLVKFDASNTTFILDHIWIYIDSILL
jgi:hypothetical protein